MTQHFSTLLYDNFISSIIFMYSHPLYLAYLLYFFPYFLRLFSFLFPLLLSTTFLLFLHSDGKTKTAGFCMDQVSSLVVASIGNVFDWENSTMLDLYNVEDPSEVYEKNLNLEKSEPLESDFDNFKWSEVLESQTPVSLHGDNFVPQTPDRASEIARGGSLKSSLNCDVLKDTNEEFLNKLLRTQSVRQEEVREFRVLDSLQRDVSMRKEKEWKRTLACKLYEERRTSKLREERRSTIEGGEEEAMDLLWEACDDDGDKVSKSKGKGKKGEEDEEDEEDETGGKICCLQALRFTTGKVHFGVGKSNLVKFSKVFKGIGSFRRSGSSRSRNG